MTDIADLELENDTLTPSRRDFLGIALTGAAGVMFWPYAPILEAQKASCVAKAGEGLRPIGEIKSSGGYLRGIIEVVAEQRAITYYNNGIFNCYQPVVRTYHGYKGWSLDPKDRVTTPNVASPGPTLRAAVGETVELMLINRIDQAKFPRSSVTSQRGRCDTSVNSNGTPRYPKNDKFPNCFHASNTTNLHFHGTHVSPQGFADNVLVGVIPNPKIDTNAAIQGGIAAYEAWQRGENPTKGLIEAAALALDAMLEAATAANDKELVAQLTDAIHANHQLTAAGEWPQYWPGFYPHFFQLPAYTGQPNTVMMGQAPGTHWYHCHQHGSTTMQLLNGMAGVFIITGDYDDKMLSIGGGTPAAPKIKEQVLLFQLFAEQPNLVAPSPSSAQVAVNGQVVPVINMKKTEVQWWRIVNGAMKAHGIEQYLFIPDSLYKDLVANPGKMKNGQPPTAVIDPTTVPSLNQTAQDGVQFAWQNFQRSLNMATFDLAPGNRADFLVQAPKNEGTSWLVFWPPAGAATITDIRANTVMKVVVAGDPTDVATALPTQAQYPVQPSFLGDILDAELRGRARTVTFSMNGGIGQQPQFFIDDKQFAEGTLDQVMLEGTAEEWTLLNTSLQSISHPFHIHVNPFQVVEVYDPSTMTAPLALPRPWIWWDTISIPAGVQKTDEFGNPMKDPNGNPIVTPGMIKMRSRFVDFPGKFVLHCHILGHEDRGMMQLIEVVDNNTVVKHH
jgi:FtsP/CotA-like multicopper oxidase with cupredoxin domain